MFCLRTEHHISTPVVCNTGRLDSGNIELEHASSEIQHNGETVRGLRRKLLSSV